MTCRSTPEDICRRHDWRLSVRPPRANNPDRLFVAHVYAEDEAIGLGMSALSALAASVFAVQSPLRTKISDVDRDKAEFNQTSGGSLEWDGQQIEFEPRWDRS